MDYFLDNWGSFVGLISLFITIIGFAVAIRRATQARTAAEASENAIIRAMTIIDLERSIALIQRLKELHRDRRWEATIEHYQTLRVMLGDIRDRYPELTSELFTESQNPIILIIGIENSVDNSLAEKTEPSGATNFNLILNHIQAGLEEISRSITVI